MCSILDVIIGVLAVMVYTIAKVVVLVYRFPRWMHIYMVFSMTLWGIVCKCTGWEFLHFGVLPISEMVTRGVICVLLAGLSIWVAWVADGLIEEVIS